MFEALYKVSTVDGFTAKIQKHYVLAVSAVFDWKHSICWKGTNTSYFPVFKPFNTEVITGKIHNRYFVVGSKTLEVKRITRHKDGLFTRKAANKEEMIS